jgi:hypothetical protein
LTTSTATTARSWSRVPCRKGSKVSAVDPPSCRPVVARRRCSARRSDSSGGRLCRHADVNLLPPRQEPKRPGQLVPSLTIEIDPDVGTLRVCCTRRESGHCVDQVLSHSPAHSAQRPSAIALLEGQPAPDLPSAPARDCSLPPRTRCSDIRLGPTAKDCTPSCSARRGDGRARAQPRRPH